MFCWVLPHDHNTDFMAQGQVTMNHPLVMETKGATTIAILIALYCTIDPIFDPFWGQFSHFAAILSRFSSVGPKSIYGPFFVPKWRLYRATGIAKQLPCEMGFSCSFTLCSLSFSFLCWVGGGAEALFKGGKSWGKALNTLKLSERSSAIWEDFALLDVVPWFRSDGWRLSLQGVWVKLGFSRWRAQCYRFLTSIKPRAL